MTPLPVVPRELLAWPAWVPPTPPRGPLCSRPGCRRSATQQHHAVARSQQRALFGRVGDWLEINGELVQILIDICAEDHDLLESRPGGCRSRLRWAGGWAWYDRATQQDVETEKAGIWWSDQRTRTIWKLRGFCKGVYTLDDGNSDRPS